MAVRTPAVDEENEVYDDPPPPRWPWISGLILSILGFGVSAYLTYEHYTGSKSLACPAAGRGSLVNCAKVTESPWSMEFGIPVAVLGLVFFAVMIGLQTPWAWRSRRLAVRVAQIVWCLVGLGAALRLIYFELYKIDAICEWCTSVHILTFLIFVVTVFGAVSMAGYSSGDPDLEDA
jgi:uncharacterized membrane protein